MKIRGLKLRKLIVAAFAAVLAFSAVETAPVQAMSIAFMFLSRWNEGEGDAVFRVDYEGARDIDKFWNSNELVDSENYEVKPDENGAYIIVKESYLKQLDWKKGFHDFQLTSNVRRSDDEVRSDIDTYSYEEGKEELEIHGVRDAKVDRITVHCEGTLNNTVIPENAYEVAYEVIQKNGKDTEDGKYTITFSDDYKEKFRDSGEKLRMEVTLRGGRMAWFSLGLYKGIKGDVNFDNTLNLEDVRRLLRIAINIDNYEDESRQMVFGDVDSDGKITLKDVCLVLRAALNLE